MIGAIILKTMLDSSGTDKMNQRNVEKLLFHWAEEAILIYPGNMPFSGKIQGKPMLTAFFETYLEHFPSFEFTAKNTFIKNMLALGMTNTVATEVNVKYTNRYGKTFENSVMSVLELKRGKLVYDKDYYFDIDTLNKAWEGVDCSKLEKYLKNRLK